MTAVFMLYSGLLHVLENTLLDFSFSDIVKIWNFNIVKCYINQLIVINWKELTVTGFLHLSLQLAVSYLITASCCASQGLAHPLPVSPAPRSVARAAPE